jgi:hypothetical protein
MTGLPTRVDVFEVDIFSMSPARFRAVPSGTGAHLVYAGPAVSAVADDPEGAGVLHDTLRRHATALAQKSLAEGFGLTVAGRSRVRAAA